MHFRSLGLLSTSLLVLACGDIAERMPRPDSLWETRSPLPVPSRGLSSTVFDGKIYAFGGTTGLEKFDSSTLNREPGSYTQAYEYDPAADAWTEIPPMPIGFYNLTAHTIGNELFVIGGYGIGGFIPAVLAYDPIAKTWSERTPRPVHSYIFASAVVEGRIVVVGGHGTHDGGPATGSEAWELKDRVDIYDPATDTWSSGAPAPRPIAGGVACALDGKVYVFGTFNFAEPTAFSYDVANDSWTASAATQTNDAQSCVVREGEIYVIGGRTASEEHQKLVQIFSPDAGTWRDGPSLSVGRHWATSSLVEDTIYVVGGASSQSESIDSMEALNLTAIGL